eukprot:evm.model.NODE_30175_length_15148_cov_20.226961.1
MPPSLYPRLLLFLAVAVHTTTAFHPPPPKLRQISRNPSILLSASSSNSIHDLVESIRQGQASVTDVTKETLRRIEQQDGVVGAFLALSGDLALAQAKVLDTKLATKDTATAALPLLGLPLAVKDNICTAGVPTTAASSVLQGYVPSYDATAVARLKAAGCILVGKTNMDEFGMGSTTESSGYHVTRNPRDLTRSPGGSSGGSAAAVASGMVLAALGTDTGGSIRQPASWTGTVGLKPTYGRVSRYGLMAYGSSTDVIGPLTQNVMDAAHVLAVLAGEDPAHDTTTSQAPAVQDFVGAVREVEGKGSKPLAGVKVALVKETLQSRVEEGVASAVRKAVNQLEGLGATVVEVSIPYLDAHCASYYVNVLSEASANLARYDGVRYGLRPKGAESAKTVMLGSRGSGFGEEVKQRILLGTFSLSAGYSDAYYLKSQQLRSVLSQSFSESFEVADVLVCPTSPTVAYPLGKAAGSKVDMYADDLFTVPASLAGLPAISLPISGGREGESSLPVGLQIIGQRFAEAQILQVAKALELAQGG